MAKISAATEEKIFQIKQFLGLNENPDGDTKLSMGEAAAMENFRVTRDGNLQRRPGTALVKGLMGTYTLEVAEEAQVVRESDGVSGQLTMYPTAQATEDGFVALSGAPVVVDSDNAGDYAGYYWQYNVDFTYELVSCDDEATVDQYTWTMKRVRAVSDSQDKTVAGLWAGNVKGTEYLLGACDGKLWKLHDGTDFCREAIGSLTTTAPVFFFGYDEKVYLLNGTEYKQWDGTTYEDVAGYRPLVSVSVSPAGGGTALEQVNKLTGQRRCWFSGDGTSDAFYLPEVGLASIDYVKNRVTGEELSTDAYTADPAKGMVRFSTPPDRGTNNLEIGWTHPNSFRAQVVAMKFAETFNGATDNRVFLYGDGSNQAFYSGLDYDGNPRADYFPDLNVLKVGEANTPITGMIRHYSRLLVYKTGSAYSVQYGLTTLADNTTMAAFYATPVNRSIGNVAPGQVRLVLNSPRTLHGRDLYEWRNATGYVSNLTIDERQAKRISDRITSTLAGFSSAQCYCWDDNDNQEYYICWQGQALVHHYAADA